MPSDLKDRANRRPERV